MVTMNDSVRDWYVRNYPKDELAFVCLPEDLTFKDFLERLGKENAYEILRVEESDIREKVFDITSRMSGIDYEELWNRHSQAV